MSGFRCKQFSLQFDTFDDTLFSYIMAFLCEFLFLILFRLPY